MSCLLQELGTKYNCGKTYQGYLYFYDKLFNNIRMDVKKVLEIGIRFGQSLNMWKEYFPNATIYGIDIEDCSKLEKWQMNKSDRIITFIGDQSNRNQMQDFIDKYEGEFDIIIDDGGHSVILQQISLGFFFKHIQSGGYYSIEDLDVSNSWRGGKFDIKKDLSNTTYQMIQFFLVHNKINSMYMDVEERRYLNKNIDNIQILHHLADECSYPFLKIINEKNFALCSIQKRFK